MTDTTKKRIAPLTASMAAPPRLSVADLGPSERGTADLPGPPATSSDRDEAERDRRFQDGVRTLRLGRASLRLEERILMVLGGIIAPLGFLIVLLGWWGAAHTPYVFEQLPYVISGGLLGLGLVFLGAFFYFTHWITQLVKEHRTQSAAVLEALERVQVHLVALSGPPVGSVVASGNGARLDSEVLVATAQGTMAHRPDCVVVAGKPELRQVAPDDGLRACRLCAPYE